MMKGNNRIWQLGLGANAAGLSAAINEQSRRVLDMLTSSKPRRVLAYASVALAIAAMVAVTSPAPRVHAQTVGEGQNQQPSEPAPAPTTAPAGSSVDLYSPSITPMPGAGNYGCGQYWQNIKITYTPMHRNPDGTAVPIDGAPQQVTYVQEAVDAQGETTWLQTSDKEIVSQPDQPQQGCCPGTSNTPQPNSGAFLQGLKEMRDLNRQMNKPTDLLDKMIEELEASGQNAPGTVNSTPQANAAFGNLIAGIPDLEYWQYQGFQAADAQLPEGPDGRLPALSSDRFEQLKAQTKPAQPSAPQGNPQPGGSQDNAQPSNPPLTENPPGSDPSDWWDNLTPEELDQLNKILEQIEKSSYSCPPMAAVIPGEPGSTPSATQSGTPASTSTTTAAPAPGASQLTFVPTTITPLTTQAGGQCAGGSVWVAGFGCTSGMTPNSQLGIPYGNISQPTFVPALTMPQAWPAELGASPIVIPQISELPDDGPASFTPSWRHDRPDSTGPATPQAGLPAAASMQPASSHGQTETSAVIPSTMPQAGLPAAASMPPASGHSQTEASAAIPSTMPQAGLASLLPAGSSLSSLPSASLSTGSLEPTSGARISPSPLSVPGTLFPAAGGSGPAPQSMGGPAATLGGGASMGGAQIATHIGAPTISIGH